MLPRPATMVTAVVVTFAIAAVAELSTKGTSVPPGSADPLRLDSGRYQHEIESLESALYQQAPPSMADFVTISAAFHDVGLAIAGRELNSSSRDVASDVALLAAQSDVGDSGYALPDIAELRADWESLRSERFVEAEWFRESTPIVEAAQVVPAPTVDPAMKDELESAIDLLEELAQEGRSACTELGEPFYDFEQPGPRGQAHIDRWNEFAREWDDKVSRTASRMPPPPAWNADSEFIVAYQDVTGSVRELRHATMGNGSWPVPFESEWSSRLDEALRLLGHARVQLSSR